MGGLGRTAIYGEWGLIFGISFIIQDGYTSARRDHLFKAVRGARIRIGEFMLRVEG
jgi:hypothetical protein